MQEGPLPPSGRPPLLPSQIQSNLGDLQFLFIDLAVILVVVFTSKCRAGRSPAWPTACPPQPWLLQSPPPPASRGRIAPVALQGRGVCCARQAHGQLWSPFLPVGGCSDGWMSSSMEAAGGSHPTHPVLVP